jgi:hypothetical protein
VRAVRSAMTDDSPHYRDADDLQEDLPAP